MLTVDEICGPVGGMAFLIVSHQLSLSHATNWSSVTLDLLASPTGNYPLTNTALSVQGVTGQDDNREFLVNLGLVSSRGNVSRPTPYHDKVTLYAGIKAEAGTGDVWAINPLVTQSANSGEYNAQGIELDFNNDNAHRGDADAGAGLAAPVSYGFAITGASKYRSTSALLVCGNKQTWNRGITFANDAVAQSTFQDLGSPEKSVDIRGQPTWGVYQSCTTSKNLFAGKTGLGWEHHNVAATSNGKRANAAAKAAAAGGAWAGPRATLDVNGGAMFEQGDVVVMKGKHAHRAVLGGAGASATRVRHVGTTTLDAKGEVRIVLGREAQQQMRLKDYVSESHVYHLTAVGAAMPALHVAAELSESGGGGGGRALGFNVAGGVAGGKVSWSVSSALAPATSS